MIIGNAKKAGVKQFICPGVDLYSSKQSIALAHKHPGVVFATVGIHPYEAQHDPDVRELERLLTGSRPVIVAIGECGLDYHQYAGENALGKKDKQKRLLAEQIDLAIKFDLPTIFHCRDGASTGPSVFDDFFTLLDAAASKPRGVLHCFSGGLQEVREAQKRGLFIGIDGNVTYSKLLQTIVPQIPLSMILLETDSPYLTPVPHRGTRNEPKYIPLIAHEIAKLHNVSIKEVEETTTANAKKLFSLLI